MKRKLAVLFLLSSLLMLSVNQLVFASGAEQIARLAIPLLVANTSFLNIRSGDGPQYTVIVTVVGGTELPVLGANSNKTWYLVTTAVGPGWVDLQFTIPRGDFRNVPTLAPTIGTPPSLPTPISIGLPGTGSTAPITGVAQTTIQSSTIAIINVTAVNLRTQPAEEATPIGIVFRYVGNATYPVVGYAYDTLGIPWIAIVVPTLGTGWIEAPKATVKAGTVPITTTTTITATGTTNVGGTIPIPELEAPHIVVNTGFQNIRTGPGPQFTVLVRVPGGRQLEVIGVTQDSSWFLVKGTFGQGWIASQFVLFRGAFKNVPVIHSIY